MSTTLTSKGQVTIPKHIRDALDLKPGCAVDFTVNGEGDVVIQRAGGNFDASPSVFDRARGKADIKWRTDELMALIRGEN